MMKIKEMEQFYVQELPEYVCAVRFDLRDGNVPLSAKLLESADKHDWDAVSAFLKQGADPRICRISDGTTCISALYLALTDEKFEIAQALYEAGDRLDDLKTDNSTIPVQFLVWAAANGYNYFKEEEKPLSECIRCGLWEQVSEKMENASKEELDLSAAMIGLHLRQWNAKPYLQILQDLKEQGADIAQIREECLEHWQRFQKMPKILRPDEETLRRITETVSNS